MMRSGECPICDVEQIELDALQLPTNIQDALNELAELSDDEHIFDTDSESDDSADPPSVPGP